MAPRTIGVEDVVYFGRFSHYIMQNSEFVLPRTFYPITESCAPVLTNACGQMRASQ